MQEPAPLHKTLLAARVVHWREVQPKRLSRPCDRYVKQPTFFGQHTGALGQIQRELAISDAHHEHVIPLTPVDADRKLSHFLR